MVWRVQCSMFRSDQMHIYFVHIFNLSSTRRIQYMQTTHYTQTQYYQFSVYWLVVCHLADLYLNYTYLPICEFAFLSTHSTQHHNNISSKTFSYSLSYSLLNNNDMHHWNDITYFFHYSFTKDEYWNTYIGRWSYVWTNE